MAKCLEYSAKKLILATGYYDLPNMMNIPGEDLPKVFHYYREPHPFFDLDVMMIGAKNSAAIAALELWRHGARVTMVHRGPGIHNNVKYWIKPDIENRIKAGEVKAYFNTTVCEITPEEVLLAHSGRRRSACATIMSSRSPATIPTSHSSRRSGVEFCREGPPAHPAIRRPWRATCKACTWLA